MSNKTRKHIWPVSLVMSIAIIGALAAFLVLAANPGATNAHGEFVDGEDHCPQIRDGIAHDEGTFDHTCDAGPTGNGNGNGTSTMTQQLVSSSTTGGTNISLTLTITAAQLAEAAGGVANLSAGDRIEIYLEDDYSVPDTISASNVYVRHIGATGITLNGGGRVSAADVDINTDQHFTVTKERLCHLRPASGHGPAG